MDATNDVDLPTGDGGAWVTPRIAARRLAVNKRTVLSWISRGTCPAEKVNRRVFKIPVSWVAERMKHPNRRRRSCAGSTRV